MQLKLSYILSHFEQTLEMDTQQATTYFEKATDLIRTLQKEAFPEGIEHVLANLTQKEGPNGLSAVLQEAIEVAVLRRNADTCTILADYAVEKKASINWGKILSVAGLVGSIEMWRIIFDAGKKAQFVWTIDLMNRELLDAARLGHEAIYHAAIRNGACKIDEAKSIVKDKGYVWLFI